MKVKVEMNKTAAYEYENSIVRTNIINWYPFDDGESILVMGYTGEVVKKYLQDVLKVVDSVDTREQQKYDYVFIMEGAYRGQKFELDEVILRKAIGYLKAKGHLLIAMSNPMGMKYWAGAAEESTGRPYVGLEGGAGKQILSDATRVTLPILLEKCGLVEVEFYYPFPDHIFPTAIYSDGFLPQPGDLRGQSPTYAGNNYGMFREDRVYEKICRDGLFPYFANAFFIVSRIA